LPSTTAVATCIGDCNADRRVSIAELVIGTLIAVGQTNLSACTALDTNQSNTVTIGELVRAVGSALTSCA
jgi:hypothetical protein